MLINLISDTVTRPVPEMLEAMMQAEVGDDVFGDDPTINALEKKVALMFGHEAALFCTSGTQSNQIAIRLNTQPLEEIICHKSSHIFWYETAAYAMISNVVINPLESEDGKLHPHQIGHNQKPLIDWLPHTSMVEIENSCNREGGCYYTFSEMKALSEECKHLGLKFHLDGARIFNVVVETGDQPSSIGPMFDTISVCLSKGLGAPVGSLLISSAENIKKARRIRKSLGGGMRQAGYLAAAGIYALDNHVQKLKNDHQKARYTESILKSLSYVVSIKPVFTNIVIFDLAQDVDTNHFLNYLKSNGVLATAFGPKTIRFVFHLDIQDGMMPLLEQSLKAYRL